MTFIFYSFKQYKFRLPLHYLGDYTNYSFKVSENFGLVHR